MRPAYSLKDTKGSENGSEIGSEKSSEKTLNAIRADKSISARTLAEMLAISPRAVEKHIARLKSDGKLKHISPAKGGQPSCFNVVIEFTIATVT
jgi:predicted HTH transcriptional regulator